MLLAGGTLLSSAFFQPKEATFRNRLFSLKTLCVKWLLNNYFLRQTLGFTYHRNEIDTFAELAQIECHKALTGVTF